MSIASSLLPEFDHEAANTRKALERLPEDKLQFKPHEKSWEMIKLAQHIATIYNWGYVTITTAELDLAGFTPPATVAGTKELLELFEKNNTAARNAIASATDEQMFAPWTLKMGDQVFFTMPRLAVLRGFVFNHIIHHRGQLTTYLRMANIPVPALYGPSADEGQMGM